jgi:large subunit ribosomal protein L10
VAKELVEFVKAHEGQLAIQGGWVDGQLLDRPWVEALAKLPPRPVLLAELVGTMELPVAALISTLEQCLGALAATLEHAAAKQHRTEGPTSGATEAGSAGSVSG